MISRHSQLLLAILFGTTMLCYCITPKERIDYVRRSYEHTMFNKQYLFYPAEKPTYLYIIFTSAVKNKYEMWSWFWRDSEKWTNTAYLFLKDEDFCWYLGNNECSFVEDYSRIINYHISLTKVSKSNAFTIGGSMGGYAAIFYATILGLGGVFAFNPQINQSSNTKNIRFALGNTGNKWVNLDELIASYKTTPAISLLYGEYSKDLSAACDLINVLKAKQCLVIFRHTGLQGHKGFRLSKKFIESDLTFFKKQDHLSNLINNNV
jgi:hypothetical protein